MDTTFAIFMGVGCILLFCILIFIVVTQRKTKKNRNQLFEESKKKDTKNRLRLLYRIYIETPVIKRYIKNLEKQYSSLFPADEITIETMVTKQMTKCLGVGIAIIIAVAIICKGDLAYTLVGITGAYILFTSMINSSTDNIERKLLDQIDIFLDDVTSYYHDSHDVVDSIEKTLDELPYEVSLHAQRMHQIVTATDTESEMEDYIAVAPNRFLLLIAAVCSSIKECGDKDVNGKSLFLTSLNYIKDELSQERLYLQKKAAAFTGKIVSVLVPLFILKPAEMIMISNMPELASFYRGIGAVITMTIIVVVDIVCYELVNIFKDTGRDEKDDAIEARFSIKKLSEVSFIKKFLVLKQNKNYTKSLRDADMLKATNSSDTLNSFTLKRYAWALVLFLVVNIVGIYGIEKGKDYVISDFSDAYSSEIVPNEEYRTTMQEMSLEIAGEVKDPDDIEDIVDAYVAEGGYDEAMAETITDELKSRYETMGTYYYRWWLLLIAIASAVIGYYIPYWLLKSKQKVMLMKREDEVAQFKTVIMILMHEDGMMLDEVLIWLNRFAKVYKPALSKCIMDFEWSQQKAIEEMREEESGFAPFRRLCDSLMAVDAVGLESAFDNLESEREFDIKKRELDQNRLLSLQAKRANTFVLIPIYTVIAGYVVLPFGMMIFSMLTEFTGIFG